MEDRGELSWAFVCIIINNNTATVCISLLVA
jgi:hypothetical protein